MTGAKTIYDCTIIDLDNKKIPMSIFKGKVLIIVNTATLCGFAPQFVQLETLYRRYKDQGLVVLAFPSNQFNNEDPKPIKESIEEVRTKYKVTFPILNKVLVNGIEDDGDELYEFLKEARPGKFGFKGVLWNFVKFIVARDGEVVQRLPSEVAPIAFEPAIKMLLSQPST